MYISLARNWIKKNVLIIGAGKAGSLIAAKLLIEEKISVTIEGFLDDAKEINSTIVSGIKVIGRVSDLELLKKQKYIQEVIIAIDNITYERMLEIIDLCRKLNINVKVASELFQIIARKMIIDMYSDIPVVDVSERVSLSTTKVLKKVTDIILSLLGLIALSPLFILITVIIKLTSSGSVLYKQIRIGKGGHQFLFYKFRTMTVIEGEDEERKSQMIDFIKKGNNNNGLKIINNNRVTRIGKFLRKTSLDELPQLFNVLRGEMSLVGPRPCLPYEYDNYDEWQKKRMTVTPGCTGVWQVFGRSEVSFNDSVVLDIYYINNMSPWLDLQIIFNTIPVMIFGRGGK